MGLPWFCLYSSASHAVDADASISILGWFIIVLQTLIIALLYFRKRRHKRLKAELQHSRKELENRVQERTDKLQAINNQLYQEIGRHEVTEELLIKTQNYLNGVINSMASVLIGVDRDGLVTHWNTPAERVTQVSESIALGRRITEVYPQLPVQLQQIRSTIDEQLPQIHENVPVDQQGEAQHLDVAIYPLKTTGRAGAVIRVDDITERVQMEAMMVQNEKLMSMGELAAGMAHEINNPLSAVLNGVQNIQRRTDPALEKNQEVARELGIDVELVRRYLFRRDIYSFLEGISEAGERSARIVKNMLEFSRLSGQQHQLTDITALLQHSLELAKNSFELKAETGGTTVNVVTNLDSSMPHTYCSPTEIQQVVLNLLRNACQSFESEACAGHKLPTLWLRTWADEESVHIEIEDNGPGMEPVIKNHIFEPFFTTKEAGKGTGLGLSVTYFIISEHHDGTIEVDSSPGQGSKFLVSLPLRAEPTVSVP